MEHFKSLEELKEALRDHCMEDAVVFDGAGTDYHTAVVGFDTETQRVIYDYDLMIEYLMKENDWSQEDAMDWLSYNTIRSLPYAGPNAPIIMEKFPELYD